MFFQSPLLWSELLKCCHLCNARRMVASISSNTLLSCQFLCTLRWQDPSQKCRAVMDSLFHCGFHSLNFGSTWSAIYQLFLGFTFSSQQKRMSAREC